jgi:hypothetical protein
MEKTKEHFKTIAKGTDEKSNDKGGNNNNGNGHSSDDKDRQIQLLQAQLKKEQLNKKYKPVDQKSGEWSAEDFLFSDSENPHDKEIVTSDLPIRMPPLLTNWETLIEATDVNSRLNEDGKVIRLSRRWIHHYLMYRKPVDRQARAEAITMGQEKQEQDLAKGAMKA